MNRWSKMLMMAAVGGALFQAATTSCDSSTLAPLIANLITSLVLQQLLGGFAT